MNKREAKKIVKNLKQCTNTYPPYDGDYTNGDHDYMWYQVNNKMEMEALLRLFDIEKVYDIEDIVSYPEWICVEVDDGCIDFNKLTVEPESVLKFTTLSECKKAFSKLLSDLGEKF